MKKKKNQTENIFENRTLLIFIISAVAIIIRIISLFQFNASIFWDAIWSDSATYNQWARNIVETGSWVGTKPFFMTPFYPYFLAVVYSIFGEDLFIIRLLQNVINLCTIILIFFIGEKLFNKKIAFVAGILASVYGPFVLHANLLLVETIKVFFGVLTLYLCVIAVQRKHLKWWAYVGFSIGAAILCRPSDLILALFIFVWMIWLVQSAIRDKVYRILVFVGAVFLMIAPVTIHNYIVSGEFIPITSNGGLNFYLGNNPEAVGIYYNVDKLDLANDPDGRVYLETKFGIGLTASQVNSYWMNEATTFVITQPIAFLQLLGKKTLLFFHYKEISQLGYNYIFMTDRGISILNYLLPFVILLPPAAVAIIVLWRKDKKYIILYGFLFSQIIAVILFFITDRFRLSAVPFFCIFAAYGIEWMWESWKQKKYKRLLFSGGVIISSISTATWVNIHIPDDFSIEYEYVGMSYFDKKEYQKALTEYQQALSYRETFHVHNNIGNVYSAVGNLSAALHEYRRGDELNPQQAISSFSMGTAYVRVQQWDSAIVYFERSQVINPRFAPAYLNAGLAYYYIGNYHSALINLERYLAMEPDRQRSGTLQRDVENLRRLIKEDNAGIKKMN